MPCKSTTSGLKSQMNELPSHTDMTRKNSSLLVVEINLKRPSLVMAGQTFGTVCGVPEISAAAPDPLESPRPPSGEREEKGRPEVYK